MCSKVRETQTIIPFNKPAIELQGAPYLMLKKQQEEVDGKRLLGNDRYEGYCADLAQKIAEMVDFEYIMRPQRDGKYGVELPNRTWNGIMGELTREVGGTTS